MLSCAHLPGTALRLLAAFLLAGCVSAPRAAAPVAALESAASRDALDGAGWRDLGWARWMDGDRPGAEKAFARALAKSPGDARALGGVAAAAQVAGDAGRALARWADLLERYDPGDPFGEVFAIAAADAIYSLGGEAPGERAYGERLARIDGRKLPAEARLRLLQARAEILRRLGDETGATALDQARGCPPGFRVAGPFGHLPRLDLPRARGATADGPARMIKARAGLVTLDPGEIHPGVAEASFWARAAGAGRARMLVDTDQPWHLIVDGKALFEQAPEGKFPPRQTALELDLQAGWHEVTIRIAAPHAQVELRAQLQAIAGAPLELAAAAPKDPLAHAPDAAAIAAEPRQPSLGAGDPAQAILDLLSAWRAVRAADSARAEPLIAKLGKEAPKLAIGWMVAAQAAAEDPSRPARLARDRARHLLEKALALDAGAERARVALAIMDLQDDHGDKALDRLRAASGWRAAFARFQAYRARGWTIEAERALAEAEKANGDACPAIEAHAGLALEHHRVDEARALGARLARCDATSEEPARIEKETHHLREAAAQYRRLQALDGRERWLSGLAEVLLQSGDAAGAERALAELVRDHPRSPAYRVRLADAAVAAGGRDRAHAALVAGLAESPESEELERALAAMGDRHPIDPFRVEGRQVIADFERSGRRYETPAVIVLDRTVTRVFPSGARMTLTHNIIRVQTKDGLDKFGEVTVPEGADVLTLRTVKRDGSVREPEEIVEKQSVSAPDLEPGDYVEFEYVDPAPPPAAFPRGFYGERFYFQSFDAPLDRTEYVLAAPAGMALQVDRRGPAPEAKREVRGDLQIVTWSDAVKAQLRPEPEEAPFAERVPSVRAGSGVSYEGWRDFLADQYFGTQRANGEVVALAKKLGSPHAVDEWVRVHIKGGGALDEAATATLAQGEGNRITLERALDRVLGVETTIWLGRPVTAARLDDSPLPDLEAFDEPILAVRRAGGFAPIDPRLRHGATGFVVPLLRGQPYLALAGDKVLVRAGVPQAGPGVAEDRRTIHLTAKLADDGSAEVKVREQLSGWPAVEWREGLDRLTEDRVRPEFEQHTLGFYFPGAELTALSYGPRDRDAEPFTVEYSFRAPRFARAEGRRLVVPAPFPALLGKRYVGVPLRETPLALAYAVPTTLQATIELPPGASARVAAVERKGAFGTFTLSGRSDGGRLVLSSTFAMPWSRLPPSRYAELTGWARDVDAAEANAAEVQLK